VPYGFGVVELAERLCVIARVVATHLTDVRLGMPVRLVVEHIATDSAAIVTYAVTPEMP
jgi:uncharacterized OB-fold protein